jgi:uncharacterized damage-inducible protein DinB
MDYDDRFPGSDEGGTAMAMSQMLLPEFDHEMAVTRKYLERVPAGKDDWRPHPKSMTLARLAGHLAEIPIWAGVTLTTDSLDVAPKDGPKREAFVCGDAAKLVAAFDKNVADARKAIEAAADADYGKPWSLLTGGHTALTLPKGAVLRSFVFSHVVHHRAQLGVYLRMNDVPLPATYGPTADEGAM